MSVSSVLSEADVFTVVEKIEQYLKGNLCGRRPTSCADQLAIGVRKALEGQLEPSAVE